MSPEEQILERQTRIEEKMDRLSSDMDRLRGFSEICESFQDLGRDASMLTYPTVKLLTEELGEVETGFQLEDVSFLLKRFLLSLRNRRSLEHMNRGRGIEADRAPYPLPRAPSPNL